MKKLKVLLLCCAVISLNSCATVLGGKVNDYQKKQQTKEEIRRLRPGYVVADILLFTPVGAAIAIFIDFQTGAIYKPNPKTIK